MSENYDYISVKRLNNDFKNNVDRRHFETIVKKVENNVKNVLRKEGGK